MLKNVLRPSFTSFHNKLECFSLASITSLVIMFAGKTETYPNEAPFRCSTLEQATGLTHKL
jgi:hypothetical protein